MRKVVTLIVKHCSLSPDTPAQVDCNLPQICADYELKALHFELAVVLPPSFVEYLSASFEEEIRWHIEDYPIRDPFITERASNAIKQLSSYACELASILVQSMNISTLEVFADSHLRIRVNEATAENDVSSAILWEALEDPSCWPKSGKPSSVSVERVATTKVLARKFSVVENKGIRRPKSILVLTSRPSMERDIPHRLITRPILEIVEGLKKMGQKIRLDIARPGTVKALTEALVAHRYDVVHLDVHGFSDGDKAFLRFVRLNEDRFEPHDVPIEKISHIFAEHGVHNVVLNACQSARGASSAANAARCLVEHGVPTAVGMSFKILGTSAAIFTTCLYAFFLGLKQSLELSAAYARQEMRQKPQRATKYATHVTVFDYINPIVFTSSDHTPDLPAPVLLDVSSRLLEQHIRNHGKATEETLLNELVGRDSDMLRLEQILLGHRNIAVVYGHGGIGKSHFIRHLSSWWKSSGFIKETLEIDFCSRNTWDRFMEQIGKLLNVIRENIVACLNEERYLIILENLPNFHKGDKSRDRALRMLRRQFLAKVKKSLVVFLSRKDEDEMQSVATAFNLSGLDRDAGVQLAIQTAQAQGKKVDIQAREQGIFLDQCLELVQGNPLAIIILIHDFCHRDVDFKQYFHILTDFESLNISQDFFINYSGGRFFIEADQSAHKHVGQDAGSFTIPDIRLLAPFWGKLPQKFGEYLCFFDMALLRAFPNRRFTPGVWESTVKNRVMSMDTLEKHIFHFYQPPKTFGPETFQFELKYQQSMEELKEDELLIETAETLYDGADGRVISLPYYEVHPVLTLALRQEKYMLPLWLRLIQKVAYARFYAYRLKFWPPDTPEYKPIIVRLNDAEFANLVTFANALLYIEPDYLNVGLMRFDILAYGMARNVRRIHVSINCWARAIDVFAARVTSKRPPLFKARSALIRGLNHLSPRTFDDLWVETKSMLAYLCLNFIVATASWSRSLGLPNDYYSLYLDIVQNYRPGRLYSDSVQWSFRCCELYFEYNRTLSSEAFHAWKSCISKPPGTTTPVKALNVLHNELPNELDQELFQSQSDVFGHVNYLRRVGQLKADRAASAADFADAESTLLKALEEELDELDNPNSKAEIYRVLSDLMVRKREFTRAVEFNNLAFEIQQLVEPFQPLMPTAQIYQIRRAQIDTVRKHTSPPTSSQDEFLTVNYIEKIIKEHFTY